MSIPPELSRSLSETFYRYRLIILIIISFVIIGFVSMVFRGEKIPIVEEVKKIIGTEAGNKITRNNGPTAPRPPEEPRGLNGPMGPRFS